MTNKANQERWIKEIFGPETDPELQVFLQQYHEFVIHAEELSSKDLTAAPGIVYFLEEALEEEQKMRLKEEHSQLTSHQFKSPHMHPRIRERYRQLEARMKVILQPHSHQLKERRSP